MRAPSCDGGLLAGLQLLDALHCVLLHLFARNLDAYKIGRPHLPLALRRGVPLSSDSLPKLQLQVANTLVLIHDEITVYRTAPN